MKWYFLGVALALAVTASAACNDTVPTLTPTPVPELTVAPTATPTSTPVPSPISTVTPTSTQTPFPTAVPTPTATPTLIPTPTVAQMPTQATLPAASPAPTAQSDTATVGERVEWVPCGPFDLECGFVEVPADYRDPEAGSIRIAVNVHRATSPSERIGYLLVNPGGPGESGVELVHYLPFGIFTDEIVSRFDIIGFDPRGVGDSDPAFACGVPGEQLALLATIEEPIDTPDEIAAGEAAANLCIESMGPVGALLHSQYVANDMDEIRKTLGADQISYLGFSYGSALGVWYATLFPGPVRAMVLDGADNPLTRPPPSRNALTRQSRRPRRLRTCSGKLWRRATTRYARYTTMATRWATSSRPSLSLTWSTLRWLIPWQVSLEWFRPCIVKRRGPTCGRACSSSTRGMTRLFWPSSPAYSSARTPPLPASLPTSIVWTAGYFIRSWTGPPNWMTR